MRAYFEVQAEPSVTVKDENDKEYTLVDVNATSDEIDVTISADEKPHEYEATLTAAIQSLNNALTLAHHINKAFEKEQERWTKK